ncbi:MAG: hypothetical protein A2902_07585 [Elusimicrobia bacterium RIFCSPLOWO2_01_FULL_64_13]|nr:MAG: hypothetical protein A2636_00170 [Elusimicrobia bacterium RIFCSPHIGHO2_01_FULL_64_10]OGR94494.1 MAG: hypothetical protein A2902_07585 [Elusimicrobia bacterium RIFCSPLOWO2_01_FULL_64_13]
MKGKKRILIVEDDYETGFLLTELLKLHNFDPLWAKDGAEGIEMVEKEMPDMILLDIMLPKVSGTEVLSVLKSRPRVKEIPVLMCTILNKLNEVEKCYELGASGYITKPYDPKRVIDKVRSIFEAS